MNNINDDFQAGRQIVVFDQIDATYPGGVHISKTDAAARFTNGVIPAGTVVVPDTDGKYKVLNVALTASNLAGTIGLVSHDIKVDDFPLASIIMSGTARIDALPDLEKTGVALLAKALPRISFI
ncbi:hypothetical protein [Chryseobacterium indologenes]|uniref:Head decoration protein n=1 Tax=Chryseobacterium indologenes TaxID=253 RepID=A0A0N0IWE9_CHRID|nr:hypothetical protein [Chryseobacterium indologenes]KPE51282.1 hypothetical protein AOB46_11405 [Chryseobacterium indologenes]